MKENVIRLLVVVFICLFTTSIQFEEVKSEEQIADEIIEKEKIDYHLVTATTYTIKEEQTDSTPLITASGYKLDSLNPKKDKVIAVSRDLKRKFRFGEKVRIKGAGKLDGVYTVRDVMNRRFTKKIDILINPDDDGNRYTKVKLYPITINN
jgi:3D (Asp-Asp-Asp) domain-containing protein